MLNLPVVPESSVRYKAVLSVVVLLSLTPMILPIYKMAYENSMPAKAQMDVQEVVDNEVVAGFGASVATSIPNQVQVNLGKSNQGQDVFLTLLVIISVAWQGWRFTLRQSMPQINREKLAR